MNNIAVMRHLISLIVCMLSLTALAAPAAAVPDTLSAGGQGVTLRSDTVIDDTSNYVISTRIPKGITRIFQNIDDSDDGMPGFPFRFFSALMGLTGIGLTLLMLGIVLLPLLLIVLLFVYLLRTRRRGIEADRRESAPGQTAPAATAPENRATSYTHRRDNAIRNIFIGLAIAIASRVTDIDIGIAVGVVIMCIGLADYFICRSHKNDNKQQ